LKTYKFIPKPSAVCDKWAVEGFMRGINTRDYYQVEDPDLGKITKTRCSPFLYAKTLKEEGEGCETIVAVFCKVGDKVVHIGHLD
jgi:hypothetical protein